MHARMHSRWPSAARFHLCVTLVVRCAQQCHMQSGYLFLPFPVMPKCPSTPTAHVTAVLRPHSYFGHLMLH